MPDPKPISIDQLHHKENNTTKVILIFNNNIIQKPKVKHFYTSFDLYYKNDMY